MSALIKFIEDNVNADYQGHWRAIYFEPIPASGERITIGIAACGIDNDFKVQRTVSTRILKCIYGAELYQGVDSIVSHSLEAVSEQLERGIPLEACQPLFTGLYLGEVHHAVTSEFRGIVKQGMQSASTFAELDAYDEEIADDAAQIRWANQVRSEIRDLGSDFSLYMNKKLTLGQRTVRFDVVKNRYVANFASIPVSNMGDYKGARSKMMDLQNLAMRSERGAFDLELIVGLPFPEDATNISIKSRSKMLDTISILREDAENRDIQCFFSHYAGEAAEHVISNL